MEALGFGSVVRLSRGSDDHVGNEIDTFFDGLNLSRPVIPEHLRRDLSQVPDVQHIWSTRRRHEDNDPRGVFVSCVREAVRTRHDDSYVLFGLSEGKYYFYFHVDGPLAVFYMNMIEHAQGSNARKQNDIARTQINGFQSTVGVMQEKLRKAKESGLALPGDRLLIICRDYDEGMQFAKKGFAWLREGNADYDAVQLQIGRTFLNDALKSIPRALASRQVQDH